jgi:CcmD family protein
MNAKLTSLLRGVPALAAVVTLLAAAAARASEYVPVDEAAQPRTDPNPFLLGAYGFIWVAVLVYVVMVARGLGRARGEVEELRKRVSTGAGSRAGS